MSRLLYNRHRTEEEAFAAKVLAGSVNIIPGALENGRAAEPDEQVYVVVPYPKRIDGFFAKAGVNTMRQFVPMPTFTGYTAEA